MEDSIIELKSWIMLVFINAFGHVLMTKQEL